VALPELVEEEDARPPCDTAVARDTAAKRRAALLL
jgi:hypothetical protein